MSKILFSIFRLVIILIIVNLLTSLRRLINLMLALDPSINTIIFHNSNKLIYEL
jgi:hypothetical protein